MQDTTKSQTEQESSSMETPAVSLGKTLSEARERLGLTVMDVASQIKFAPKQIEALEADDFGRLPEAAFLRGFIRSYAKVLHLDAEALLAALPQNKPAQPGSLTPVPGEPFPDAHAAQKQNMAWLGASLLLIAVVVGFAFWQINAPPVQTKAVQIESPVSLPEDVQIKPVEPPLPESGVIEAVSPIGALAASAVKPEAPRLVEQAKPVAPEPQPDLSVPLTSLRLEFIGESWVEIKDRDDKILSSRVHLPDTELRLQGRAPFSILIGNAPSVRLFYQDKEVDLARHTRSSTQVAGFTLE